MKKIGKVYELKPVTGNDSKDILKQELGKEGYYLMDRYIFKNGENGQRMGVLNGHRNNWFVSVWNKKLEKILDDLDF